MNKFVRCSDRRPYDDSGIEGVSREHEDEEGVEKWLEDAAPRDVQGEVGDEEDAKMRRYAIDVEDA